MARDSIVRQSSRQPALAPVKLPSASPKSALIRAERIVREDHCKLEGLIARLEAVSDGPALFSALEVLRQALIAHFVHEEHPGGLFDCLQSCVPQRREELARLMLEHHHIMVETWELCNRARFPRARYSILQRELVRLVRKVQDHEQREHGMIREALGNSRKTRRSGTRPA